MTAKEQKYVEVMLEEMNGKFDFLLEVFGPMPSRLERVEQKVDKLTDDMHEVKADIKTLKFALTETNKDVRDHERRITKLETNPA